MDNLRIAYYVGSVVLAYIRAAVWCIHDTQSTPDSSFTSLPSLALRSIANPSHLPTLLASV